MKRKNKIKEDVSMDMDEGEVDMIENMNPSDILNPEFSKVRGKEKYQVMLDENYSAQIIENSEL